MAVDDNHHRPRCLEDEVFGLDSDPPPPEPPAPTRPTTGGGAVVVDPATRFMLPVVVACVVVGVSLWSISKSMQYNEVFLANPRYRYGLFAMNAVVVFGAVTTLCVHHHHR